MRHDRADIVARHLVRSLYDRSFRRCAQVKSSRPDRHSETCGQTDGFPDGRQVAALLGISTSSGPEAVTSSYLISRYRPAAGLAWTDPWPLGKPAARLRNVRRESLG